MDEDDDGVETRRSFTMPKNIADEADAAAPEVRCYLCFMPAGVLCLVE
jgi:hypothetical protein